MKNYKRIIFVAKSGTTREAMAKGIFEDFSGGSDIEVLARGLVVAFPEPMNQKAEAVLIGNGITLENFTSQQLTQEDITEETLLITMEKSQKDRVLETFTCNPEDVFTLNELAGEELEVMDPYGGTIPAYGLCYEALRGSIRKLIKRMNGEEVQ